MDNKGIISGHIYKNDKGDVDVEVLSFIHNDYVGTDIFCDIDHALIDSIDIGDSVDYYFIARIESTFERTNTFEGVEYDVIHHIKEIRSIDDMNG